jgi:hypothetical protein
MYLLSCDYPDVLPFDGGTWLAQPQSEFSQLQMPRCEYHQMFSNAHFGASLGKPYASLG